MNKYLEKLAGRRTLATAGVSAIGAAAGAGIGALKGEEGKKKKSALAHGVAGAIVAPVYYRGSLAGKKNVSNFLRRTRKDHVNYQHGYNEYRAKYPFKAKVGKHHTPLRKLDLHEKSFGTRAEFDKHFKRLLHKAHPDRMQGNTAEFQRLSGIRDKIQASTWYKRLR
jgi:hypothetical protein